MNGYFKLHRKFFSHELWGEKRIFSKAEAWIDLMRSASWKDSVRLVGNELIELKRGQYFASLRFLATRWGWSVKKVNGFLGLLEKETMITTRRERKGTHLTLCNYDAYNEEGNTEEPEKKHKRNAKGTPREQSRRSKEGEEGKEKKPIAQTQAIAWSCADGFTAISDQDREEWKEAYPACDITRQLAAASQWLKANPTKAKKKQWRRFITSWLARSQERGGDTQSNRPRNPNQVHKSNGPDISNKLSMFGKV